MDPLDIHWPTIWRHLVLLGTAYILALPTGWNRETHDHSAGLRTFPLVAVATCGFVLVALDALPDPSAHGRVLQGVITGMGFIGGGAILKSERTITGTATAASLWSTGAMGVAVALLRFEIAFVLALLTFLTLQFMPAVKPLVLDEDKAKKSGSDPEDNA